MSTDAGLVGEPVASSVGESVIVGELVIASVGELVIAAVGTGVVGVFVVGVAVGAKEHPSYIVGLVQMRASLPALQVTTPEPSMHFVQCLLPPLDFQWHALGLLIFPHTSTCLRVGHTTVAVGAFVVGSGVGSRVGSLVGF